MQDTETTPSAYPIPWSAVRNSFFRLNHPNSNKKAATPKPSHVRLPRNAWIFPRPSEPNGLFPHCRSDCASAALTDIADSIPGSGRAVAITLTCYAQFVSFDDSPPCHSCTSGSLPAEIAAACIDLPNKCRNPQLPRAGEPEKPDGTSANFYRSYRTVSEFTLTIVMYVTFFANSSS